MNVRAQYYNTAPRGVQSKDYEVVKEEIEKKQNESGRKEDEELPQGLRLKIARRILDAYM